jgi:hypothetical protein
MRGFIAAAPLPAAPVLPDTEVRKKRGVVHDDQLAGYLTRIEARLGKSPRAGKFTFPNESRPAGALADEITHAALRQGTHEASEATA